MPRGHELHVNVLAQLQRCERLIALESRLPAIIRGEQRPADAGEAFDFADVCGLRGQLLDAARLYTEALAASPQPAADLGNELRYRAVCAAALIGWGRRGAGSDLGPEERARWRSRAREWLEAEMILWTRMLDSGPQADRVSVRDRLARMWADPDLDGLLEHESPAELTPAERRECDAVRSKVDALILRAQAIK
jgi:serine/threonine-protein kinase